MGRSLAALALVILVAAPAHAQFAVIDNANLAQAILIVQRVARAVKKAFDAPGVLVMQFNEPAAGQTVFHTHFHVIPRFEGVALKPHSGGMADPKLLAEQAAKIKAVFA